MRQNAPAAGNHGDSYPLTSGSSTTHVSSNNRTLPNYYDIISTKSRPPDTSNATYFPDYGYFPSQRRSKTERPRRNQVNPANSDSKREVDWSGGRDGRGNNNNNNNNGGGRIKNKSRRRMRRQRRANLWEESQAARSFDEQFKQFDPQLGGALMEYYAPVSHVNKTTVTHHSRAAVPTS